MRSGNSREKEDGLRIERRTQTLAQGCRWLRLCRRHYLLSSQTSGVDRPAIRVVLCYASDVVVISSVTRNMRSVRE